MYELDSGLIGQGECFNFKVFSWSLPLCDVSMWMDYDIQGQFLKSEPQPVLAPELAEASTYEGKVVSFSNAEENNGV